MARKLSKRHLAQKMKLHFLRMKSFKKLRQELRSRFQLGRIDFGPYGSAPQFLGYAQSGSFGCLANEPPPERTAAD